MAYVNADYKNAVKVAFEGGVGSSLAEDEVAQALADALGVAIAQLDAVVTGIADTDGNTLVADGTVE